MSKKQISTAKAPAAIGPYSQGIVSDKLLFVSGQLALDPATGKLIEGTISEQTSQIMNNIRTIAEEAGASLNDVLKTTIFLTDLSDFQEVNKTYGSFFNDPPPARATIGVAALPLGAKVEIEAIVAVAPSGL